MLIFVIHIFVLTSEPIVSNSAVNTINNYSGWVINMYLIILRYRLI